MSNVDPEIIPTWSVTPQHDARLTIVVRGWLVVDSGALVFWNDDQTEISQILAPGSWAAVRRREKYEQ